jgi:hypothetical protein
VPVLVEQQDHAGVVGRQPRLSTAWPQDAHLDAPHGELHPRVQAQHGVSVGRGPLCQGRHRIVLDVGHSDPVRTRDPGKAVEPPDVVRMRVREDQAVEAVHPGPGERLPQDHRVGTGVHE